MTPHLSEKEQKSQAGVKGGGADLTAASLTTSSMLVVSATTIVTARARHYAFAGEYRSAPPTQRRLLDN